MKNLGNAFFKMVRLTPNYTTKQRDRDYTLGYLDVVPLITVLYGWI